MLGDRIAGTTAGPAGYETASDPHGPGDDIVPGLSSVGPPEVMEKLARLHAAVTGDRTLLAILVAAEEIAARWRLEHDHLDQHWLAYETALAAESEARRTLDMLLRTLARLADSSLTPRAEGSPTHTGRSQDTLGDGAGANGRIRADREADACPPVVTGSAELVVCLFGRFRLFGRGQLVVGWHGSKTPRIVRYLFAQRGRPVPRDVLIDLFWPDVDPETARRNLHQTIYVIRKALREACDANRLILFADEAYAVNTSAGMWCDAEEFEACSRAGRWAERELKEDNAIAAYESAERLYSGEFLEDSPYEDWAIEERDRLRLVYLEVTNRLADLKLAKGDVEAALDLSQRALVRDSCNEAAHRRALRCHAAAGNRTLVIHQYEAYVNALDRAYGLEPTRETTELYASLLGS